MNYRSQLNQSNLTALILPTLMEVGYYTNNRSLSRETTLAKHLLNNTMT